jgi:hypothetical protein
MDEEPDYSDEVLGMFAAKMSHFGAHQKEQAFGLKKIQFHR